jgi:hypothetical protein
VGDNPDVALGALIGAYQEDDSGGLRALLPLAGRTLLEYQVRCVSAVGAGPIVVIVERVPQALQDAFERLRLDGIGVFPVSDVHEAVSRFEAGSTILLVGDGIAPSAQLVTAVVEEPEAVVATVPDDEMHEAFERIDGETRWAGIALVDSKTLGSTAAILGDWDLQSTLLRRTIQDGAVRWHASEHGGEPLLAERPEQLEAFQRQLVQGSPGARRDWASRFVLPPLEDLATHQLMRTSVRPIWLIWGALVLTVGGAIAFGRGWLGAGLGLLCLSTPLDLIAARLAAIRLKPLPKSSLARSLLWPAAGAAALMLGWWKMGHASGWGALLTAIAAAAFAEAARIEGSAGMPGELWVISRRNAILLAIPFAIFGTWTAYLIGLFGYSAASFFYLQHAHRVARVDPKLTEIG